MRPPSPSLTRAHRIGVVLGDAGQPTPEPTLPVDIPIAGGTRSVVGSRSDSYRSLSLLENTAYDAWVQASPPEQRQARKTWLVHASASRWSGKALNCSNLSDIPDLKYFRAIALTHCHDLTETPQVQYSPHVMHISVTGAHQLTECFPLTSLYHLVRLSLSSWLELQHPPAIADALFLNALHLSDMPRLTTAPNFAASRQLRTVHIGYCHAMQGTFDFSHNSKLEQLRVEHCTTLNPKLDFSANVNAQKIIFDHCPGLTDTPILPKTDSLVEVVFTHCGFNTPIPDVSMCPKLRKLNFEYTFVSRIPESVFQMSASAVVQLTNSNVTPEVRNQIAQRQSSPGYAGPEFRWAEPTILLPLRSATMQTPAVLTFVRRPRTHLLTGTPHRPEGQSTSTSLPAHRPNAGETGPETVLDLAPQVAPPPPVQTPPASPTGQVTSAASVNQVLQAKPNSLSYFVYAWRQLEEYPPRPHPIWSALEQNPKAPHFELFLRNLIKSKRMREHAEPVNALLNQMQAQPELALTCLQKTYIEDGHCGDRGALILIDLTLECTNFQAKMDVREGLYTGQERRLLKLGLGIHHMQLVETLANKRVDEIHILLALGRGVNIKLVKASDPKMKPYFDEVEVHMAYFSILAPEYDWPVQVAPMIYPEFANITGMQEPPESDFRVQISQQKNLLKRHFSRKKNNGTAGTSATHRQEAKTHIGRARQLLARPEHQLDGAEFMRFLCKWEPVNLLLQLQNPDLTNDPACKKRQQAVVCKKLELLEEEFDDATELIKLEIKHLKALIAPQGKSPDQGTLTSPTAVNPKELTKKENILAQKEREYEKSANLLMQEFNAVASPELDAKKVQLIQTWLARSK
jgi:hypothetical protein